jgi:hypothetical protein
MEIKTVSRRTEIAYKAERMDEVAQHAEVQDQILTVNAAVVQWQVVFLSREICPTGRLGLSRSAVAGNSHRDRTEVSRSHSRFGSRPASGTIGNELRYSWRWSHPTEGRNLHGYATMLPAGCALMPTGGAKFHRQFVEKAHVVRGAM